MRRVVVGSAVIAAFASAFAPWVVALSAATETQEVVRDGRPEIRFCTRAKRVTCVVDGDTFWWQGRKMRLAGVNAGEPYGRCDAEWETSGRAAIALRGLLNRHPIRIETVDRQPASGRYPAREIVRVHLPDGRTMGEVLLERGLVVPAQKGGWC